MKRRKREVVFQLRFNSYLNLSPVYLFSSWHQ